MYLFKVRLSEIDERISKSHRGYVLCIYVNYNEDVYDKVFEFISNDLNICIDRADVESVCEIISQEDVLTTSQLIIYLQNLVNKHGNKPIVVNNLIVKHFNDFVKLSEDSKFVSICDDLERFA